MSEENTTPEVVEETTEEVAAEAATEETTEAPAEEVKEEAPAADDASSDEGEDVEIPAEFAALVEQVENMTVLELHTLVKLLEKKFGVSAAAVAVAGGAAAAGGDDKTEFDVVLESDGGAKIPVMKAVKEILGLGLKEAKEFVEGVPANIKEGVSQEEADEIKAKVEEAGGKVAIK